MLQTSGMIFLASCATPPVPTADDGDAAELVGLAFPSSMDCDSTATATVTMRNTGTTTWTLAEGYKLGAYEDEDAFYTVDTRVRLPDEAAVAPGETYTFEVAMVAPRAAGTYRTDWQMVKESVHWFGEIGAVEVAVECDTLAKRTGRVSLVDGTLVDDGGPFNALGATMFWAAWGYRNDRDRLDRNLAVLQAAGFDYIRALGVVGDPDAEDYWDGREIDDGWEDYDGVIAGLTDHAYDNYGLRVEWTLVGDGQVSVPTDGERYALADRFLAMSQGREEKIIHFEVANEYWQNGFDVAQLRTMTQYLNERTDILVAASAPAGHDCEEIEAVYAGGIADLATIHFDRDTSMVDGGWRPVRQPWGLADCSDVPTGSNNEPIGPGSSVASEEEPVRLVSAAIASYVSNVPLYVFHSRAGVRGDEEFADMAGVAAYHHVRELVPGDVAGWNRKNGQWSDAPFQPFAEDTSGQFYADLMWTDIEAPAAGVVRVYSGDSGNDFFSFAFGILDHVTLGARRDMEFVAYDPMTGEEFDARSLAAGELFTIEGVEAAVIRGEYR